MIKRNVIVVYALLSFLGCGENIDRDDEVQKALFVLDKLSIAMNGETSDSLAAIMAHDEDIVCFYLQGRFVGWDALKTAHEARAMKSDSMLVETRNQIIKLSDDAMTAWFSQEMILRMKTASGVDVDLINIYTSGGMERRDGRWLIVQFHASERPHTFE